MLSFVRGMMCVGCCWWRFGTAIEQPGAAVALPEVVVPVQRSTSSRTMQTHELLALEGKSPHIWCTPHGEKFHNTQSCSGLRNAKSTRKYERCLLCGQRTIWLLTASQMQRDDCKVQRQCCVDSKGRWACGLPRLITHERASFGDAMVRHVVHVLSLSLIHI